MTSKSQAKSRSKPKGTHDSPHPGRTAPGQQYTLFPSFKGLPDHKRFHCLTKAQTYLAKSQIIYYRSVMFRRAHHTCLPAIGTEGVNPMCVLGTWLPAGRPGVTSHINFEHVKPRIREFADHANMHPLLSSCRIPHLRPCSIHGSLVLTYVLRIR